MFELGPWHRFAPVFAAIGTKKQLWNAQDTALHWPSSLRQVIPTLKRRQWGFKDRFELIDEFAAFEPIEFTATSLRWLPDLYVLGPQ
jgi:hypothetical protein